MLTAEDGSQRHTCHLLWAHTTNVDDDLQFFCVNGSSSSTTHPRWMDPWWSAVTFSGGSSPVQLASAHGAAVPGYAYGTSLAGAADRLRP